MTCPVWTDYRPPPTTPQSFSKVLVIGDSIGSSIAMKLAAAFAGYSMSPTIHNYAIGSSAIAPGVGAFDWVAHTSDLVDVIAPSVVVAHFLGSQGTTDETMIRAKALISRCKARGVKIAWCIPARVDPTLHATAGQVDTIADAYLSQLTPTWKPNLRGVLTPLSEFTDCLVINGYDVPVIGDDGLHYTTAGNQVAADAIVNSLH